MEEKISIRMTKELEAGLRSIASEDGCTLSVVVREALEDFVEQYEKVREKERRMEDKDEI